MASRLSGVTGANGSMTASVANGFAQVKFDPKASQCTEAPYAFHPEYSTANPRGNTWSLHTYNVAMSDEISHFENCLAIDANGNFQNNFSYQPGGPGDIVVVRLFYQYPVYVSLLGFNLSNVNVGKRLLAATAAFRNEPYSN